MRQTDPEAAIQRCGHGKPVKTPDGSWYMVYLCGRTLDEKYSILGRETALDPITWTPDGWPLVNNLKGPSALQVRPLPSGALAGRFSEDCCAILKNRPRKNPENRPGDPRTVPVSGRKDTARSDRAGSPPRRGRGSSRTGRRTCRTGPRPGPSGRPPPRRSPRPYRASRPSRR